MRMLEHRMNTIDPRKVGHNLRNPQQMILIMDHSNKRSQRSASTGNFARVDETEGETSKQAGRHPNSSDDSNFQHYTLDKGEIRIKKTHSKPHHHRMSHSSRTMIGSRGQEILNELKLDINGEDGIND
jgi:hypothetical protein